MKNVTKILIACAFCTVAGPVNGAVFKAPRVDSKAPPVASSDVPDPGKPVAESALPDLEPDYNYFQLDDLQMGRWSERKSDVHDPTAELFDIALRPIMNVIQRKAEQEKWAELAKKFAEESILRKQQQKISDSLEGADPSKKYIFTFVPNGNKLGGSVKAPKAELQIADARMDGNKVWFSVKMLGGLYTAKVQGVIAGDELTMETNAGIIPVPVIKAKKVASAKPGTMQFEWYNK